MAETGGGRLTCDFELDEFAMDHFAVNDHRLEVPELVLELAFGVLATKEVHSVLDVIRLNKANKGCEPSAIPYDLHRISINRALTFLPSS